MDARARLDSFEYEVRSAKQSLHRALAEFGTSPFETSAANAAAAAMLRCVEEAEELLGQATEHSAHIADFGLK